MFKRLFSKETNAVTIQPKTTIEVHDHADVRKQFWQSLNITKGKNKMFRRLRDIYQQLPTHMSDKIKQIDYLLASNCAEQHKMLTLVLNEIFRQNTGNKLFLEDSLEFADWFAQLERACVDFRTKTRDLMHEFLQQLHFENKHVDRLNDILHNKATALEQLLGLDKIEDLKSNLIDIAVVLGRDSEQRLTQNVIDEPVRNIIDSFEYNLGYFEKMMSSTTTRLRKDIERCYKVLSLGKEETDVTTVESGKYQELIREIALYKASYKFYHPVKLIKAILSVDSTCHRLAVTRDGKNIVVGGNGCKLRQRDLASTDSNTYSEKSSLGSHRV
jgi:hypothetical protein